MKLMDLALVVMAAGIGSRFGGAKQLSAFGPKGETLLEYALYDARRAGFNHFFIVIQEAMQESFMDTIFSRLGKGIEPVFIFQEQSTAVPPGIFLPKSRQKPWGTGHALLAAQGVVSMPFLVINADDFYGPSAYVQMADFLSKGGSKEYALLGYPLRKTLSAHGGVSRALCEIDKQGHLIALRQFTKVECNKSGKLQGLSASGVTPLDDASLASMNFWGFQPIVFPYFQEAFNAFLKNPMSASGEAEFGLPDVVEKIIYKREGLVLVLPTEESWCGVTYAEDVPYVEERIHTMITQGVYPKSLWGPVVLKS